MRLVVALLTGGCLCPTDVTLHSGEKVDSLYYHERRAPDGMMIEMWIDFNSRHFRFKCGQHDALGWESRRFESMRLDLVMEGREWRSILQHIKNATVEAWPGIDEGDSVSPLDATAYYLRMRAGDKTIERFAVGTAPKKFAEIQSVIQFALSHKDLCLWPGEGGVVSIYPQPRSALCQGSVILAPLRSRCGPNHLRAMRHGGRVLPCSEL